MANVLFCTFTKNKKMTYQQLITELKKKDYKPMYLLHGKESYFIDKITQYIENEVLSEAEKGFNFTVLYGKETNFQTVVDVARRYPMMAERQVVILKEAQQMRDIVKLDAYAKQPTPSAEEKRRHFRVEKTVW